MLLLKGQRALLFFDSWYATSSLTVRFLQYPLLNLICNIRSDSAMYENYRHCPASNQDA